MSIFVDNAISGWIQNAEKSGELKNNPYRGKELDLEEYFRTPAEHRLGMKILKDANCIPPAVEVMQKIEAKRVELEQTSDATERAMLESEIRALELKKNMMIENQ